MDFGRGWVERGRGGRGVCGREVLQSEPFSYPVLLPLVLPSSCFTVTRNVLVYDQYCI